MYLRKAFFSPLTEHLLHMGEAWQGLGSSHEELSPATCSLGGRIKTFGTALADPIIRD